MSNQVLPGAGAPPVPGLTDKVPPEDKDEFYHDILDGLSVFLDCPYISDIQFATKQYPFLRLGHALNLGQVSCKKWLLDTLADAVGTEYGTVHILGGWYGVLGAMFLNDPRFELGGVVSVDIEPSCRPIAEALNRTGVARAKFSTLTADIYDLDYRTLTDAEHTVGAPDLLVNTSCEHLAEFGRWFDRVPAGTLMVLQSNDYFDCEEHHNCVKDLEEFLRQAPLSESLFEGERRLKKYTRFMLVGRK